jgi:hypothetical protein
MEIITTDEVQLLTDARGVLLRLEQRLTTLVHNTVSSLRGYALSEEPVGQVGDLTAIGRAIDRAEGAESGIFDLLNTLSSYLDDPVAKAWVGYSKFSALERLEQADES